jgi:hypothetical protein
MSNEIAVIESQEMAPAPAALQRQAPMALMPVMDVAQAVQRRKMVVSLVGEMMKDGEHYGKLPGTSQKMLFKPGAELLATFFGLEVSVTMTGQKEDWDKGIFAYTYKAVALHGGQRIAECEGTCTNYEKKYRFLWIKAKPPESKEEQDRMMAMGEARRGDYGWQERIENPNPFDLINTVKKMAQVRAYKGAVILATNSSAFFSYLAPAGNANNASLNQRQNQNTQQQKPQQQRQQAQAASPVIDAEDLEEPLDAAPISGEDQQKLFWERVKKTNFDSREAAPIAKAAATGEITWPEAFAKLPPL